MFIPNFTNLHQNCYQSKSIPIQFLHNPKTIQSHPIEQFPTLNPSTSLLILPNPIPYLPPEEKTSRCLLQNNTKSIKSAPKHHDSTSQQTIISSTLFSLITNPVHFQKPIFYPISANSIHRKNCPTKPLIVSKSIRFKTNSRHTFKPKYQTISEP